MNISQTLEDSLRAKLEDRWLAENKEAIASYNEHIEKDGIFGSGTRRF